MIFLIERHIVTHINVLKSRIAHLKPPFSNKRDLFLFAISKIETRARMFGIDEDYVIQTMYETIDDFQQDKPYKRGKKISLLGQYYHRDKKHKFPKHLCFTFIHRCVADEKRDFPEENMIVPDYDSLIKFSCEYEVNKDNLEFSAYYRDKRRKERINFLPYELNYLISADKSVQLFKKIREKNYQQIMNSLIIIPINYVPPPPHIDKND